MAGNFSKKTKNEHHNDDRLDGLRWIVLTISPADEKNLAPEPKKRKKNEKRKDLDSSLDGRVLDASGYFFPMELVEPRQMVDNMIHFG